MMRVARPGGAVYVHGPNALACYEGHYKLFWLPLHAEALARWYLRARTAADRLRGHAPAPSCAGRLESLFRAAGARVTRLEAARGAASRDRQPVRGRWCGSTTGLVERVATSSSWRMK